MTNIIFYGHKLATTMVIKLSITMTTESTTTMATKLDHKHAHNIRCNNGYSLLPFAFINYCFANTMMIIINIINQLCKFSICGVEYHLLKVIKLRFKSH